MKFLKNLRLFKFEDIITMVSRSGGGATPPSVMALLNTTFWNFRVSRYLTDKTDLENGSLHLVMLWLASSKGGHADWGCWTGLCINSHSMMRITMILCWQHHNGESMLPCRSHKSMHTCSVKEICSSGDHYHCDRTKCDQGDDCFLS